MPNILHSLIVDEVSLLDAPSNASTDPCTGRKTAHARVAFYKRDTGDPRTNNQKEQHMFSRILKSDNVTRDQIVVAVQKRAAEVAQGKGCSVSAAEAAIWREFPELMAKYESAPKPINPRREPSQLVRGCSPRSNRPQSGHSPAVMAWVP
jgi:hypothetical protein